MRAAVLLIIFFVSPVFAFVNIEEVRTESDEGLSGGTNGKIEGRSGNSQRVFGELSSLNLVRREKDEYILVGKYAYGESRHVKDTHAGSLHGRWARWITDLYASEIFAQTEFNEFRALQRRDLAGGGARLRLFQQEKEQLFLGLGAFYEHELFEGAPAEAHALRANIYLSLAGGVGSAARGSLIVYYQPKADELADYRLQFDSGLSVPANKNLAVIFEFNLQVDSRPVEGVTTTDTIYLAGASLTY